MGSPCPYQEWWYPGARDRDASHVATSSLVSKGDVPRRGSYHRNASGTVFPWPNVAEARIDGDHALE